MGFEIKDLVQQLSEVRPKAIFIDGKEVGDSKPSICGDRLKWHTAITLKDDKPCGPYYLMQSHAPSPRAGLARLVLDARREARWRAEKLAWLEQQLGTTDCTDEQLERVEL